ncbi:MAG: low molecular weight protein arginine phosphatase [Armatimonadetes bacterium]|nr:low molecular weight protein arginine phosphatase [Armatimonadota bacterium]
MAKKILFVCTGNTCRSSMAEAIARKMLRDRNKQDQVQVSSAGTAALPDAGATEQAIAVMEEMGINLREHKATLLTPELVKEADLVLTMTGAHKEQVKRLISGAKEKVFTLAEFAGAGTDILDPIGGPVDVYRQCAADLRYLIGLALDKIKD